MPQPRRLHHKRHPQSMLKSLSNATKAGADFFFCRRPLPFGGSPLEAYSRTSGESNHHRQSVNDTRVPWYQLSHEDTWRGSCFGRINKQKNKSLNCSVFSQMHSDVCYCNCQLCNGEWYLFLCNSLPPVARCCTEPSHRNELPLFFRPSPSWLSPGRSTGFVFALANCAETYWASALGSIKREHGPLHSPVSVQLRHPTKTENGNSYKTPNPNTNNKKQKPQQKKNKNKKRHVGQYCSYAN